MLILQQKLKNRNLLTQNNHDSLSLFNCKKNNINQISTIINWSIKFVFKDNDYNDQNYFYYYDCVDVFMLFVWDNSWDCLINEVIVYTNSTYPNTNCFLSHTYNIYGTLFNPLSINTVGISFLSTSNLNTYKVLSIPNDLIAINIALISFCLQLTHLFDETYSNPQGAI